MPLPDGSSGLLARVYIIAGLRSIDFLVEEALRIAAEDEHSLIAAKLSEVLDCIDDAIGMT